VKNVVELLRPAQRTQNLAILLSDMKGFTARTSQQTREENARMLALHDALLVPVVKGFGGHKVKSIGDALGLPAGTIASRISRCLAKVRAVLEGRS